MLLNLDTGRYHGLDAMGGRFLDALEEHDDVAAAVDALAADHGIERGRLERDMAAFCRGLRDRGLIEPLEDERS